MSKQTPLYWFVGRPRHLEFKNHITDYPVCCSASSLFIHLLLHQMCSQIGIARFEDPKEEARCTLGLRDVKTESERAGKQEIKNESVCVGIWADIKRGRWWWWGGFIWMVLLKWFIPLSWQPTCKSIFKRQLTCHAAHMCCLFGNQQLNM